MPTLLSMSSPMARYLFGDLTLDESQGIEEAVPFDYSLGRELETAKEELTAAYVIGRLRGKKRRKFENTFLASEEGKRKIKFARAWIEKGGSARPDLTSPLRRYVLSDMTPDEMAEVEEKLRSDDNYRQLLEAAEDELVIAYFHKTLTRRERKLFEANYLISDRMIRKLRFAHIICEYERASVAPSPTPENAAETGHRRLGKVSRK
jgi:hypothetical protein